MGHTCWRCSGFDDRLPEITLSDVEELRRDFPDLAASLSVPESNALSNLLARSFNQKLTKEEGETLHSLQVSLFIMEVFRHYRHSTYFLQNEFLVLSNP